MSKNKTEKVYEFSPELSDIVQTQLIDHLEYGKDWEKMETPIKGVYIIKFPAGGGNPAKLLLEIKPSFEIGMLLESLSHYKKAEEAIKDTRTSYLMEQIKEANNKFAHRRLNRKNNVHNK
jgi:hypothetical protein